MHWRRDPRVNLQFLQAVVNTTMELTPLINSGILVLVHGPAGMQFWVRRGRIVEHNANNERDAPYNSVSRTNRRPYERPPPSSEKADQGKYQKKNKKNDERGPIT